MHAADENYLGTEYDDANVGIMRQYVMEHPESFSGHTTLLAMEHFANALLVLHEPHYAQDFARVLKELSCAFLFDEKVGTLQTKCTTRFH